MTQLARNWRSCFQRVASAAVAISCIAAFAPAAGVAYTSGPIHTIELQEDRFLNYDFRSTSASRTNTDWPIGLVFYGNAWVNKVHSKFKPWLPWIGSAKYAKVNNGTGWVWTSDDGRKNPKCPTRNQTGEHMRLYASPSTGSLWNRQWGYYVIGSTHYDHNECWTGSWFGYSDTVENWIAARAREIWGGGRVHEDYLYLSNPMYGVVNGGRVPYQEGDHIWWNDGYATVVNVP